MICTETVVLDIAPLSSATGKVEVEVPAACVNMHKEVPTESTAFSIAWEHPTLAAEVGRLFALPEFAKADAYVRQYAIWTLTDNPRSRGYVEIVSGFGPAIQFGEAPELSEEWAEAIRALFLKAAIPPERYLLFNPNPAPKPRPPAQLPTSPSPATPQPVADLFPNRVWIDQKKRKLEAKLIRVEKDEQGFMKGLFERPNGERFDLLIGKLSSDDIALVKGTMRERGLLDP